MVHQWRIYVIVLDFMGEQIKQFYKIHVTTLLTGSM